MLTIFCDSHSTYTYIRHCAQLSEYPAHSIETLDMLPALSTPLPFVCSLSGALSGSPSGAVLGALSDSGALSEQILLIAPHKKMGTHELVLLGMATALLPHANLLYVSAMGTAPHTLAIPFSIAVEGHPQDKTQRPIYFDMLIDFTKDTQTITRIQCTHIHSFFLHASQYYESHKLYYFDMPLPDTPLPDTPLPDTPHDPSQSTAKLSALLHDNINILAQIPNAAYMDKRVWDWFSVMKQKCKLSATESRQLYTLLEGYVQHDNAGLPSQLLALLDENPTHAHEKKALLHTSKHILMEYLH